VFHLDEDIADITTSKGKLMMRFLISVLILIATFGQAQPTDEQQIREAWQRHNQAIEHHDTVAIANFWTTDFHVISSRNMEARSSEQNRQFLSREFKSKKDVCAHPKLLKGIPKNSADPSLLERGKG
jgi:hypothetical protein